MPYIGGELSSFWCAEGGDNIDVAFATADLAGGELGGVGIGEAAGTGPGGQYGMCLFGTGVDERGVLRERDGVSGGVVCRMAGCC